MAHQVIPSRKIPVLTLFILLAVALIACAKTSRSTATPLPPTPTAIPTPMLDKQALLEQTARGLGGALAKRQWVLAHSYFPEEFKAKCPAADFATLITFAWPIAGVPDNISFVLDGAQAQGDEGRVSGHFEKDGVKLDLPGTVGQEDETEPDFIWRGGRWIIYVSAEYLAQEKLCSLDLGPRVTPTPPNRTAVPSPTPTASAGYSRSTPASIGTELSTRNEELSTT